MKNLHFVSLFLVLGLLFSCKEENESLIIANNFYGTYSIEAETSLILSTNHNFYLFTIREYEKPTLIKGKYSINKDTIHFQSTSFLSKAIIKDNKLELIGLGFKLNVIENHSSLNQFAQKNNEKDFSFFTSTNNGESNYIKGKSIDISQKEIRQIKRTLQTLISTKKSDFHHHFKQSQYFKQCICVLNKKGERLVWINCLSKDSDLNKNRWKNEIIKVNDGGEDYFQLTINLTTGTIIEYHLNGDT